MSDDDNVVTLDVPTKLDIPVRRVLEAALEAEDKDGFAGVIVIGEMKDGSMYRASSTPRMEKLTTWLELAKFQLLCFASGMEDFE